MSKNSARNNAATNMDENYDVLLAEETFILEAQMCVQEVLLAKKISQRELASRMGVTESYISQMMSDSARNLTLRTIARIMHALEVVPKLTFEAGNENSRAMPATESSTSLSNSVWADPVFEVPGKLAIQHGQIIANWEQHDEPLPEFAEAA